MNRMRPLILMSVMLLTAIALIGCGAKYRPLPYMAKDTTLREPIVCHDAVGHVAGHRPWVLGGTCCCTPTPENYQAHLAAGTIDKNVTYQQYLRMHKDKGVVTDLDHTGCGNVCDQGPHVTLGGKCMCTPSPGTPMYEQVTFGPHEDLTKPVARR